MGLLKKKGCFFKGIESWCFSNGFNCYFDFFLVFLWQAGNLCRADPDPLLSELCVLPCSVPAFCKDFFRAGLFRVIDIHSWLGFSSVQLGNCCSKT